MRTWLGREEVEQLIAIAVADTLERAAGAVAVLRTKQSQLQGQNLAWYMLAVRQAEEAVRATATEAASAREAGEQLVGGRLSDESVGREREVPETKLGAGGRVSPAASGGLGAATNTRPCCSPRRTFR